jgi:serine/threonine protein kinase
VPLSPEDVAKAICSAEGLTLKRRAGAGAFKYTFEVESAGQALALKIYKPGHSVERAVREIEAMTRCNHPNIAILLRVAKYSDASGSHYFSLEEFLTGGTLTSKLSAGAYSIGELRELAAPLVSAVAHLAGHRLVHRDIKPDNVMLRHDGVTPVLVDFGLVRDLSAVSITPTWAMHGPGTPLFAAPEQLHNQKQLIDWRADQFSLGVLLSYAAFGFHPYAEAADAPQDIVARVAARVGPTVRFRNAVAGANLPALVRMTAPWPYQRFTKPDSLVRVWAV